MHTKNHILHIRAERDLLSEAHNQWIVDLKYSFQVFIILNRMMIFYILLWNIYQEET